MNATSAAAGKERIMAGPASPAVMPMSTKTLVPTIALMFRKEVFHTPGVWRSGTGITWTWFPCFDDAENADG
jgi:hypothetical protein